MIKMHLTLCGLLLSFVGAVAHSKGVTDGPYVMRRNCATLGLAFHNSAAIVDENISTMQTRGGSTSTPSSFLVSMKAQFQKLTDTANALEHRYGKADTAIQVIEARALSEKPLRPMRDLAEICLK